MTEPRHAPADGADATPRGTAPTGADQVVRGLRMIVVLTLVSRVLGMLRDTAMASLFRLSVVGDAFVFAFRVPNLTRRLFGEGALSAAFLPIFARTIHGQTPESRRAAWALATAVFVILSIFLTLLVVIAECVLLGIFVQLSEQSPWYTTVKLTAVMLPYAVLICLAAQVTAVLHALNEFTWPELVPIVMNVCLLAAIWLVIPGLTRDEFAQALILSCAVLVAGVFQLVVQFPPLWRLGFRPVWSWTQSSPQVRSLALTVLPVTLSMSITQISTFLDAVIAMAFSAPEPGARLPGGWAYPLATGAVSALYYGERVYQFPLGVFGVALGKVLFPRFSADAAAGAFDRLSDDLQLGLRLVIAVGIPASIGLVVASLPTADVLFHHGDFTAADTHRTAAIIAAYGSGVWAYCAIPMLYRALYALDDRRSPLVIGLLAVVADLVFNLLLIWPFGELGLALTTVAASILHVGALLVAVRRRLGVLGAVRLLQTAGRSLLAGAAMAVVCLALQWLLDPGRGLAPRIGHLVILVGAGIATYLAVARLLGLREPWVLLGRGGPSTPTEG